MMPCSIQRCNSFATKPCLPIINLKVLWELLGFILRLPEERHLKHGGRTMKRTKPPSGGLKSKASVAVQNAITQLLQRGRYLVKRYLPLQLWKLWRILNYRPVFLNLLWRWYWVTLTGLLFAYFATLALFSYSANLFTSYHTKLAKTQSDALEALVIISKQNRNCLAKWGNPKNLRDGEYRSWCEDKNANEIRQEKELKRKIQGMLNRYNSPLLKDKDYTDSLVRFEKYSGIKDFAYFAVSLAGAEQTFKPPQSYWYNPYGIGFCDSCQGGSRFTNWDSTHKWLADFIHSRGIAKMDVGGVMKLWPSYASGAGWGYSVSYFLAEIKAL